MLHRVADPGEPETGDAVAGKASWYARNAEAMERGLAWIAALLGDPVTAATQGEGFEHARRQLAASGEAMALDRLGQLFGLASFDLDVLLLAAAASLDPVSRGALAARSRGGIPDQQLALALFASGSAEQRALARARFAAGAPLRRFRFLHYDGGSGGFEIDERIAELLVGNDAAVPSIEQCFEGKDHGRVPENQLALVEQIAAAIDTDRPRAVLLGPKRGSRVAAAAGLALRFGLGLRTLRPRLLPADAAARYQFLGLLAREAALGNYALLADADDVEGRRVAEDLLHGYPGFVIVVTATSLDAPAGVPVRSWPRLETADRLSIWRQSLDHKTATAGEAERLAEHFDLGSSEIAGLTRHSAAPVERWAACRELAASGLAGLSERIVPRLGWDDIVLAPEVASQLRAIAAQVRYKPEVLGRGGFGRSLVRGRGTTVLFAGPSGVGKTAAAEVVAQDLDYELHKIDLAAVVSKYIGETERNLRQVFDAAEAGGCVLFFDEADALFGKRTEVKDSHDRYANIEISYLLQRMEAFSGLAILATNLKNNLDPAFLRRLRYVVDIPYPDAAQREAIWRRAFPGGTRTEGVDYPALARLDLAGGNITVVAINAAYLAAADHAPVTMQHVEQAARAEFSKLDRDFRGWR